MSAPGIQEPLSRPLERVLRHAVADHTRDERRNTFGPVLHAGFPGGRATTLTWDSDEEFDQALRVDVVEAMTRKYLAAGQVPLLWLTRMVEGHDVEDLAWATAVGAAAAELGVRLDLVVVTRHWWHDPRSDVRREWKRMRPRG